MSTRLVPNPTTRWQFYIEYVQHVYKIDRTSTETMLNQAAGAAPPAAEPRIIEYLSVRGGRRSI